MSGPLGPRGDAAAARAVFRPQPGGLVLTEVAPGVEVERDIRPAVEFDFRVSPDVKPMDPRLFLPGPLGLKDEEGWRE